MSSNPISNLNSRRDDMFSLGDNNKPGTRARHTANNSGLSLHNAGSQSSVNNLEDAFSRQFSQNAAAKESFHKLMRQTFTRIADSGTTGATTDYNYNKAEALRQQAVKGDLSWLPEVEVLSNEAFSKAQFNGQQLSTSGTPLGAFGDDTIMLNESILSDPSLTLRVYAEEAGHALDKVLNQEVDSAGDEGAIFQKLLSGEKVSAEQMKALKAENDHGVLNGKEVEFRDFQNYTEAQLRERIQWATDNLHFDGSFYYNKYPDVQKIYEYEQGRGQVPEAGGILGIFTHYSRHGIKEGRRATLEFDPAYYVKQNPALKGKSHREVYDHWINHGIKNGLKGSADFDIKFYLSKYRGQIKDYAEKNSISYGSAKITTQAERDNFNAFVHWRKEGREKGLIGTLASDIKTNIFAVAYKNASDGLKGAAERYGRLDKAFANREKDNAGLDKVVTEISKFNKGMTKPGLNTAIATMNRAGVEAHLKGDIKRIVALAAHSEANNVKGAKALNETLKKSIADQDIDAFNEVAAKIIDQRKGPKVTIKWIDGALTQRYAKLDNKDKTKVDTDTTAFIASIARTKVEAYIKGDINHMLAIGAFRETHSKKGNTAAKELNDAVKEAVANKDAEAIDKAGTKMIGYLKNSKISTKWVDEKTDWYAKQTFPDKTKVDADATAFNTQQHLIGDVNRLVAVATQNVVAGKEGAKENKAELLESIANRDNAGATKIGLELLEKNPDLTIKTINHLEAWHKGYVDKIEAAQTHLMKDARRMLALATHDEVNGVEGGKARNDALKESFVNKDIDAFTRVASEIVIENPHLSVKLINETYTPWYDNDYKSDDKASLEASAIAFNATIGRAKTEAYFLGDIERLVAVASKNEVAGKVGAKENKAELFKSVANNDTAAVSKIGQEILELNSDLTTEKIDGLVKWHKNYVTQIQDAQAHLMNDAKLMLALATHNEVNGVEGGKARNDALKESFANKDLDAFTKVASEIVVENPHLSVKWINETLAPWYANDYKNDSKASLDASATAFNATIARAKTEAYIKDDIKHLVALVAHSENAGVKGAKVLNETLKKSIEAKDYEAIDQVASKIIDQRTGPEMTIEWVDKDLTQWYASQTFAGKGKVDTDITALKADRNRLDAITKNVVAIAYQDLTQDEEGAKVRWTNLKEGLENKDSDDGAALEKATKAIVTSNKGMSIAEVEQAVVEYTQQTESSKAEIEQVRKNSIVKLIAVAYQDISKGKEGAEARVANLQEAFDNKDADGGVALAKAINAVLVSNKGLSAADANQAIEAFIGAETDQPKTESVQGASDKDKNSAEAVNKLKQTFQSKFAQAAKNAENFNTLLDQAFGSTYDHDAAEKIRTSALNNDFAWLPDAEVLGNDVFAKANVPGLDSDSVLSDSELANNIYSVPGGAFDGKSILLNESILSDSELANKVYAEEAGHALDKLINQGVDAKGDEGAIFQKVLFGEDLSAEQLDTLKAENDQGTLADKPVEFFSFGGFVSGVGNFFSGVGTNIATGFNNFTNNVSTGFNNFTNNVSTGFNNFTNNVSTGFTNAVNFVSNVFTPASTPVVTTYAIPEVPPIVGQEIDVNGNPVGPPNIEVGVGVSTTGGVPALDVPKDTGLLNIGPLFTTNEIQGTDTANASTPDTVFNSPTALAAAGELITPDFSALGTSLTNLGDPAKGSTNVDQQFGHLDFNGFGKSPNSIDPGVAKAFQDMGVNQKMDPDGIINGPAGDPPPNRLRQEIDSFFDGAIKGNFSDDNSSIATAGKILGGFFPPADVRDIIASGIDIVKGKDGAWGDLFLDSIAFFPVVGDGVKGIFKHGDNIADGVKHVDGGKNVTDFPEVAAKISQKQNRHIGGRPEHAARGGGYLDSFDDAQAVLDAYKSGSGTIIGESSQGFPIVRVDGVKGTNVNVGAGIESQSTNVFMIKGTKSPSVVPVNPNWKPQ